MSLLGRLLGTDKRRGVDRYRPDTSSADASARRRAGHRARVFRDGDAAGERFRGRRNWT
ncbi:hypothetical protein ACVHNB_32800 [Streptomyces sp. YJ-C3]